MVWAHRDPVTCRDKVRAGWRSFLDEPHDAPSACPVRLPRRVIEPDYPERIPVCISIAGGT